jgi:hypothetical protein
MKAGRLSFAILVGTLSSAAAAVAGEPGPPVEPEAVPYDDETQPPGDEVPGEAAPAIPTPPVAPPPAPTTPADDAGFGFAGQITISDDLRITATQVSFSFQGQTRKETQIQLRPAVDVFPIANLSLGGQLILGYASFDNGSTSTSQTELGLLARIGYTFSISSATSIWPRLAFGYDHPTGPTSTAAGATEQNFTVQLYVPIVYQLVPHFFIGGGPIISTQLVAKMNGVDAPKETTLGLVSTLGGCFRGW